MKMNKKKLIYFLGFMITYGWIFNNDCKGVTAPSGERVAWLCAIPLAALWPVYFPIRSFVWLFDSDTTLPLPKIKWE